jgi:hypothetical protein
MFVVDTGKPCGQHQKQSNAINIGRRRKGHRREKTKKEFAVTAAPEGGLAFNRPRNIEKERIETCTRGRGKTCGNHRVSALSVAVLVIGSLDSRRASRLYC